ncbi:MAG: DUF4097 family beta strand repeat protein [Candidatus Eisenbacteria sp.]|nr:DUF4097 family beta strand repeat protein [Candidatus Eisenbacteria bacterium]
MRTNSRNLTMVVALALAVAVIACPVVAQEKIDESASLKSDGTVIISNISGSITVTGWGRDKVEIKGTLGKGAERLAVEGDKKRLEIRVELPKHSRNVEKTILDIKVPKGCRLDVSAVSADVDVSKCEGKISIQSVSGDVGVIGRMERLEAESVSGDVDLEVDCDDVVAASVSGDLHVEGASGKLNIATVSGDCRISGGEFASIRMESVSGEVEFAGRIVGDGSFSFDSHSGDVVLTLARKSDAEFEITTFSGDIDNDFGSDGERSGKYSPGKELFFTLGSGAARVEVNSFSGDIYLKKK